jgi:hypothetical protein
MDSILPRPEAVSQSHENHAARAHPEYVVLDIGAEFGALIVHADAELHGVEVEISRTGEASDRQHKDILERSINGRPVYTAVFDQLEQGRYTLWTHGVPRARRVAVTGGEIAELDWTRAVPRHNRPASG